MYYMTIDELKVCMPSVFTPGELESIGWSNYTQEDLEPILGRSEGFIDSLRFKGEFVLKYQHHAFPRKLATGYVIEKDDERLKKALCCIVYDYLKNQGDTRADLIRSGVKSISTGGVSESYGDIKEVKIVSENYVRFIGFCLFKGVI